MTAKIYQNKPVQIEAIQFIGFTEGDEGGLTHIGTPKNAKAIIEWVGDKQLIRFGWTRVNDDYIAILVIQTLEGEMTANVGDYIIKGVKGEFYPYKPDIFALSYEEVV